MKIALVCSSIIPNGGTERAISNLTNLLKEIPEVSLEVISLSSQPREIPSFKFSCSVIHCALPSLQSSIIGKIKWYNQALCYLNNFLREHSYDGILGIGHNINVMLPFVKTTKCKIYGCEHIAFQTIPSYFRIILKGVYPRLDGLILLSETAKKKMRRYNDNLIIIPNSLSFKVNTCVELTEKRIIMVGRLSLEKGYNRLVPIATAIKAKHPEWIIEIFGDGPEKESLKDLFQQNFLDDYVLFQGQTTHIAEVYQKSSILILTSYSEALPMVILEANSYGIPVVGYECEGTFELIDDENNGYLIKNNDVNSFVDRLNSLIENLELRKKIGSNALQTIQCYDPAIIKNKWCEFFQNMK